MEGLPEVVLLEMDKERLLSGNTTLNGEYMVKRLTKAFIESNWQHVQIKPKDGGVLAELNSVGRMYECTIQQMDDVFEKMDVCMSYTLRCSLDKKHKKLCRMEKELNKRDIALRRQLGIYLSGRGLSGEVTASYREKNRRKYLKRKERNNVPILE